MEDKPIDKSIILKELEEFKSLDFKYSDGRILGSMCSEAHPFAKQVFTDFLDSNLGDPGLFRGTYQIEKEVIHLLASLLSFEDACGNIVTGGTEANLMAMRAARNYARKYKSIEDAELILPKTAHFSFKKAADMLNLKIVEVDVDENYKIDLNSLKESISSNTVAIVAIAGTTELGVIDPVEDISKIAKKHDIYLHVDAAFGGLSIPFLKDIGYDYPTFDFSLDGVCSITVDPHKMGLAPIPAGGILFKDRKYLEAVAVDSPYLTIKKQSTIVGTRLGASAAATYAVMKYLGREGYTEIANQLMENTFYLKEELVNLGYNLVIEPELNIVAFNHPEISANDFEKILKEKGWMVSVASYPKAVRIVLMNHIKRKHLEEFLEDLKELI